MVLTWSHWCHIYSMHNRGLTPHRRKDIFHVNSWINQRHAAYMDSHCAHLSSASTVASHEMRRAASTRGFPRQAYMIIVPWSRTVSLSSLCGSTIVPLRNTSSCSTQQIIAGTFP